MPEDQDQSRGTPAARQPPRPLLAPGTVVAGYEILALVGKGGMGEVYRARQVSMDRIVALKVLAPHLAKKDPVFAKHFVDEARAAGRFNNPNIVHVHDVGQAPAPEALVAQGINEVLFFSMEFIEGETVQDLLKREGVCSPELVARVMTGMAAALSYAEEQGIVHRDIKPDNIMLGKDGSVRLADLGLATEATESEAVTPDPKSRGKVMGTPLYMSPQQARALPLDHRSDQYSLGATLFHMLAGRPPFQGDGRTVMAAHVRDPVPDPAEVRADAPEAWCQLCMRLMAKEPSERFATSGELREAVRAAIRGLTLAEIERQNAPLPWRTIALVGGSAALLLVGLLALGSCPQRPSAPEPAVPKPAPPAPPAIPATAAPVAPPPPPVAATPVATKAPPATVTAPPASAPAAKPPSDPWAELRASLDPLRQRLDYLKIRGAVESWRSTRTIDAALAEAAAELGALASRGEGALRAQVLGGNPVVDGAPDGKPQRMRLVRITLTEVVWNPADGQGEQRIPRTASGLPWARLLDQALTEQGVERRDEIAAATLWMWNDPAAAAAIARISSLPTGKALQRLRPAR